MSKPRRLKKIVPPIIGADLLAFPGVSELYAIAEQMSDRANALDEERQRLMREIACLKTAKKKAARAR